MKSEESILRQKDQIRKWKENHPDSHKIYLKTYYENNKEKVNEMNKKNYYLRKAFKELLAIEV